MGSGKSHNWNGIAVVRLLAPLLKMGRCFRWFIFENEWGGGV